MMNNALTAEMLGLRRRVVGVTGSLVATIDGLLVASDTEDGVEADHLAAVAAAGLSIARRTVEVTDRGALLQTMIQGRKGCTAVYAVGDMALMVVLGDEGLDLAGLHGQSRPALERIGSILTEGERWERP